MAVYVPCPVWLNDDERCPGEWYVQIEGQYEPDTNAGPDLIVEEECSENPKHTEHYLSPEEQQRLFTEAEERTQDQVYGDY